MMRSRLDVYVNILKALARGSSKLTHIMYQAEINYKTVRRCLNFLIKQNLVKATPVGKRRFYHLTERGIAVLETLSKLENTLQVSCSSSCVAEQTTPQFL